MMPRRGGRLLFFLLAIPGICLADRDILVVLGSDAEPYLQALAGFQETAGEPREVVHLAQGPLHFKGQPRIVVTFGGKAAHQHYPPGSILIYALAPGTFVGLSEHEGPAVQMSMMPAPAVLLEKLTAMQPGLKRLA